MINHDSIDSVKNKSFRKCFMRPAVDSYYFGRIPGTLSKMLTGNPHPFSLPKSVFGMLPQYYDKVICLFIDAFGWRFVEEFRVDPEFPLLQRIMKEGCASALSSQFPSTTSVHVPTIMTGVPAGQHHLTEWYYHSSEINKTVAPLLGTTVDGEVLTSEELLKIYPRSHIIHDLQRAGVTTICNASARYVNSFFNKTVTDGAERVGFSAPELGLQNVVEQVSRPGKSLIHFYCDTFDSNLHECGPGSPEAREALRLFFSALESALPEISKAANGTLGLVIIADHGQEKIDPDTVILVDEIYPSISIRPPLPIQNQRCVSRGDVSFHR